MNMPVVCPPESTLADLLQGKIDEPELGDLAEHLQHCRTCQERARPLPTLDSFAALLGTDPQPAIEIASGIPRLLIEKAKNIAHDTASFDTSTNGSSINDEGLAAWNFLAPPQATDEIGRLGGYRILQVLGRGGMGIVFRAEDPNLKRIVALKAMLPTLAVSASAKKRFLREAQAAASLKHDHIVTIHQVGEDRGVPFLAMEFLHGEGLDVRLKRGGKLPLAEVLRIGREVAEGLGAAHEAGLIHRDIKPGNIWLERRRGEPGASATGGRVKILDFGLVRPADDHADLTSSGAIVGTPAFMSPEQAQDENVDHRCDLFSLGCMLYVMATGTMPFAGKNSMSRLLAMAMTEPTPPDKVNPALPSELSDLILRLLAKDPAKRSQDAHAVAAALQTLEEQALRHDQTTAISAVQPMSTASRGETSGGFLLVCGIAVAAAMLAAGAIVFYFPSGEGTIRVEIPDDQIEVVLDKSSAVIKKADKKHDIVLTPGEYGFHVKRGDLDFHTDKLILKKGATIRLKVEYFPGKLLVARADGNIVGEKVVPPSAETPAIIGSVLPAVPPRTSRKIPAAALSYNGHHYLLVKSPGIKWLQAKADAEAMGGYLLTVTSKSELDFIGDNVFKNPAADDNLNARIFMGGVRKKGEVGFHWITGEPFDSTLWPNPTYPQVELTDMAVVAWVRSEQAWTRLTITPDRGTDFFIVEWDGPRPAQKPLPSGQPLDLLPLVNLDKDVLEGEWSKDGAGFKTEKRETNSRLRISVAPGEPYSLRVAFSTAGGNLYVFLPLESKSIAVACHGGRIILVLKRHPDPSNPQELLSAGVMNDGKRHELLIDVSRPTNDEARIRVTVDGQLTLDWKGTRGEIKNAHSLIAQPTLVIGSFLTRQSPARLLEAELTTPTSVK